MRAAEKPACSLRAARQASLGHRKLKIRIAKEMCGLELIDAFMEKETNTNTNANTNTNTNTNK